MFYVTSRQWIEEMPAQEVLGFRGRWRGVVGDQQMYGRHVIQRRLLAGRSDVTFDVFLSDLPPSLKR